MLNRTLMAASAFCLITMMVVTLADAIGRYFLALPIPGASEIVGFLLGYTIFFAMPVITRERTHITVGVLAERLPKIGRTLERAIVWLVTLGGFALVTWLLFDQTERMRRGGDLLTYIDLPRFPFAYPLVVLAGIAALVALLGVRDAGKPAGGGLD